MPESAATVASAFRTSLDVANTLASATTSVRAPTTVALAIQDKPA